MRRRFARWRKKSAHVPGAESSTSTTISPAEAADLLEPLTPYDHVAIAVSGGPDSVALMVLAAEWANSVPERPRLTAITIDHGLRGESRAEAESVANWADQAGIPHVILTCRDLPPGSRLQERARDRRYDLLCRWCRDSGANAIALGHTLDDQAETVLMRLARGSGLDGLSAMRATASRRSVDLVRPFLTVAKSRLIATLQDRKHPWFDDPSNLNEDFERVRVRATLRQLTETGLTSEAIALAASRLAKAREAIDWQVGNAMQAGVRASGAGFCRIELPVLVGLPQEIIERVLERCLTAIGGGVYPPGRDKVERLCVELLSGAFEAATLGGGILRRSGGTGVIIARELRPGSLEALSVRRGESALWDGRFNVAVAEDGPEEVIIRALGETEPEDHDLSGQEIGQLPADARLTLASVWYRDRLIGICGSGESLNGSGVDIKFDDRDLLRGCIWGVTV